MQRLRSEQKGESQRKVGAAAWLYCRAGLRSVVERAAGNAWQGWRVTNPPLLPSLPPPPPLQVSVVVTDRVWVDGRLVEETRYESEREVEAVQEEEGEEGGEWEMDMGEEGEVRGPKGGPRGQTEACACCFEGGCSNASHAGCLSPASTQRCCVQQESGLSGGRCLLPARPPARPHPPPPSPPKPLPQTQASSSRARSGAAAVEEELFDDDAGAFQQPPDTRLMLAYTPHFSSAMAGPHEAASMLLGAVVDLGAQPSVGDVHGVAAYVHAARDVPAAVLLAAALDSLPEALEGGAEVRAALGELCAEHDVSLDAAVDAVLLGGASDPELRAIEEELAEYSYVC